MDGGVQSGLRAVQSLLGQPSQAIQPEAGSYLLLYLAASAGAVSAVLVQEEASQQKSLYFISEAL